MIHVDINKDYKPQGYALLFHPDLIHGTPLGKNIDNYHFLSFFKTREALHLSEKGKKDRAGLFFSKLNMSWNRELIKHTRTLIAANIELFLNYCVRFYDRQFITRNDANKDVLEKV